MVVLFVCGGVGVWWCVCGDGEFCAVVVVLCGRGCGGVVVVLREMVWCRGGGDGLCRGGGLCCVVVLWGRVCGVFWWWCVVMWWCVFF